MKKCFICFVLACLAIVCISCENRSDSNDAGMLENTGEYNGSAESNVSEFISEVSRENYKEIPNEAMESFNYVSDASKVIFKDVQGKWMYGYKGIQKICDEDCHVFTIYSETDETSSKVGTLAKSLKTDSLYILDISTGKFTKSDLIIDNENSWANTPTKTLKDD